MKISHFFVNVPDVPVNLDRIFLSLEEWLLTWSDILNNLKAVYEFPIWLQYLAKVLFQVVNTSGNISVVTILKRYLKCSVIPL